MSEVNWRQTLIVSSLVLAVLLVCGSIYLHVHQKHHMGRIHHEDHHELSFNPVASARATQAPRRKSSEISESADSPAEVVEVAEAHGSAEEDDTYDYNHDAEELNEDKESTFKKLRRLMSSENLKEWSSAADSNTELPVDAPLPYPSAQDDDFDHGDEDDHVKGVAEIYVNHDTADLFDDDDYNDDDDDDDDETDEYDDEPFAIKEACMQCICETTSECMPAYCGSEPCGVFRISRPYWIDAKRQQVENDSSAKDDSDGGYSKCVNDMNCSYRTIFHYLNKYFVDCDEDGTIDCRDFIKVHILGPSGCKRSELGPIFESRMEKCFSDRGYTPGR